MQSDDPPYLVIGTEVSAKFKGAFCEAKIKKLTKSVKCKVNLQEHGIVFVEDKDITGTIVLNGSVEVTQGKNVRSGIIQHIKDCSQYLVVFNDGDERNLRRSQVCLKSGRHFDSEGTLDSLPLYNPEQFCSPVIKGVKRKGRLSSLERSPRKAKKKINEDDEDEGSDDNKEKKRKKRAAAHAATAAIADIGGDGTTEEEGDAEDEVGDEDEDVVKNEEEEEKEEVKVEVKKKKEDSKSPKKKEKRKSSPMPSPAKKRKEEEKEKEKEKELKKKKEEEKKQKEKEKKDSIKEKKKEEKEKEKEEKAKEKKKEKDEKKAEKKDDKKDESKKKEKSSPEKKIMVDEETPEKKNSDRPVPGTVLVIEEEDSEKGISKWFPAVATSLKAYKTHSQKVQTLARLDVPCRSFQNGRYMRVKIASTVPFEGYPGRRYVEHGAHGSTALKQACERANAFITKDVLPSGWERDQIYDDMKEKEKEEKEKEKEKKKEEKKGEKKKDDKDKDKDKEKNKKENEKEKEKVRDTSINKNKKKEKEDEKDTKTKKEADVSSSSSESESDEEEEEYGEDRDLFIAQLYKFHEERGTPINKAPVWGGRDLDLYRLYKVVQGYGGYKRACDKSKWKKTLLKLKLDGTGASPVNVRKAYQRYLLHFNSVYKHLGWKLEELSATTISGQRSARRPVDYGFSKRKRTPATPKDKEGSIQSQSTVDGKKKEDEDDERMKSKEEGTIERSVKKEEEDESRVASSSEASYRRSLSQSRVHSNSPASSQPSHKLDRDTPSTTSKKKTSTVKKNEKKAKVVTKDDDDALSSVSSSAPLSSSTIPYRTTPDINNVPSTSSSTLIHTPFIPGLVEKDDGYLPANIFSHFYLGQKVRACHNDKWYDARVVVVHQSQLSNIMETLDRAIAGGIKREPDEQFTLNSLDELREMTKKVRCLVHYLGWNSRYDEYLTLPKMRISPKDDESSMRLARVSSSRISEEMMTKIAKWSRSPEGLAELCPSDKNESSGSNLQMGSYRPRRVSFTQYEQLSAASTSAPPSSTTTDTVKGGGGTSPKGAESPSSSSIGQMKKEMNIEMEKKEKEEVIENDDDDTEQKEVVEKELIRPCASSSTPLPSIDKNDDRPRRIRSRSGRAPSPLKTPSTPTIQSPPPPPPIVSTSTPVCTVDESSVEQTKERDDDVIDDKKSKKKIEKKKKEEEEMKKDDEVKKGSKNKKKEEEKEKELEMKEDNKESPKEMAEPKSKPTSPHKERKRRRTADQVLLESALLIDTVTRTDTLTHSEETNKDKKGPSTSEVSTTINEDVEKSLKDKEEEERIRLQAIKEEEEKKEEERKRREEEMFSAIDETIQSVCLMGRGPVREVPPSIQLNLQPRVIEQQQLHQPPPSHLAPTPPALFGMHMQMPFAPMAGHSPMGMAMPFHGQPLPSAQVATPPALMMSTSPAPVRPVAVVTPRLGGEDREDEEKEEEERKKKQEDEEQRLEDEDEAFDALEAEARMLCRIGGRMDDDRAESSTKSISDRGTPAGDDTDGEHSHISDATTTTTNATELPMRGKQKRRKHNQSNMVLDRKYVKKKKETKADEEEEEEDDDEPAPIAPVKEATLHVLKQRLVKSMEAEGVLHDFEPLGLPHITHSGLYGERTYLPMDTFDAHFNEMRDYYLKLKDELSKLEKRNKISQRRRQGLPDYPPPKEKPLSKAAAKAAAAARRSSPAAAFNS